MVRPSPPPPPPPPFALESPSPSPPPQAASSRVAAAAPAMREAFFRCLMCFPSFGLVTSSCGAEARPAVRSSGSDTRSGGGAGPRGRGRPYDVVPLIGGCPIDSGHGRGAGQVATSCHPVTPL